MKKEPGDHSNVIKIKAKVYNRQGEEMSTSETVCSFLHKKGMTRRQTKVCHKSTIQKKKIMLLYRGS